MLSRVLILSLSLTLLSCDGTHTVVSPKADPALINISGSAEKFIDPNMLVVAIEVYGKSDQAKVAQDLQATEYARVKKSVEQFKIKNDDFVTENMSLTPEYRYDDKSQSQKTVGFLVSHQIRIVIREIKKAGEFLDVLSSSNKIDNAGVNINSIEWDNDSRKSVLDSLIADAVADARKKADLLAKASDVHIKGIQSMSYNEPNYGGGRPQFAKTKMAFDGASRASTELGKGTIMVRADVNIQYMIE